MKDEELEVLITVDDPEYAPEEDIFDHSHGATASASSLQQDADKTIEPE